MTGQRRGHRHRPVAYDPDSGLTSLTVECSPARTYHLSWTQPGVHSAVDV